MVYKRVREVYTTLGLRGLILFGLYKILYFKLQNFKSTLQLMEWARKERVEIRKNRECLMLDSLPFYPTANFYFRPFTSDAMVVRQHFFQRELAPVVDYFKSISHDPKLMVDAGGNIGAATRFLQLHFPGLKSLIIEPSESNCRMIKKNIISDQFHLVQGALWYEEASLSFSGSAEAWAIKVKASQSKSNTIPGYTLSEILKMAKWGSPDFIKIDIEGAEEEIFEKDTNLKQIFRSVKCVTVEPHSELGKDLIHKVFQDCGFQVEYHGELIFGFRDKVIST
jgi:FkbM family methyltransferase